jgi:DNA primase
MAGTMKKLDEDTLATFLELKKAFRIVEVRTRKAIRELIQEADPETVKAARVEYLKDCMTAKIVEAIELMAQYEDYQRRDRVTERLLTGERLQATAKAISRLQGEIISLRKPDRPGQITSEDIQRAKAVTIDQLVDIGRYNTLVCPFHADSKASMKYYPGQNKLHCFSCNKTWDSIDFLIERDGLSFPDAVKKLQ